MAVKLPKGIARYETIDKTKYLTPKQEAYSFINSRVVILEGKLKHESFLLSHESFERIQEEIDIYRRLLNEI